MHERDRHLELCDFACGSSNIIARHMSLTIEDCSDHVAFDRLRPDWIALEKSLFPRTPFTSPTWHETWWRHLRRKTWHTRDDLALYSVRNENRELIAVAPFMRSTYPGVGPLRISELQGIGADPNITELRGLVCHAKNALPAIEALKAHFIKTYPRVSWITWNNVIQLECDAVLNPSQADQARPIAWKRSQPAYIIAMPETWTYFEANLTKKVRKKLRSCSNSLQRDNHRVSLNVVVDPYAVASSLRTFYNLVAMRSQIRHADPFARPEVQTFFNDYSQRSSEKGELRIFELRSGQDVVACRIGFALGSELYLYHSGNLPAWDRYSIMTTLLAEIFKWAISNNFRHVNLSTGLDRSKTRWRPQEIMYNDAIDVMPGRINAVLYRAFDRVRSRNKTPQPSIPDDRQDLVGSHCSD